MRLTDTLVEIEKAVGRVGLISALILLPCLMSARVLEILLRNFNLPGSLFNAMEREFFLLFAMLIVGSGYAWNTHVRVDILRDRFSPRRRAWIEGIGAAVFILPFAMVVLWYGTLQTGLVLSAGERAAIAFGAPLRWIVVGAMPYGILLFLIAVLARCARAILFLRGLGDDPFQQRAQ